MAFACGSSFEFEYTVKDFHQISKVRNHLSAEQSGRIISKIKSSMEMVPLSVLADRVVNCTAQRDYLAFFPEPNLLFCVPCLLFKNVKLKKVLLADVGYEIVEYHVAHAHIMQHERTQSHLHSYSEYSKLKDDADALNGSFGNLTIQFEDLQTIDKNRKVVDSVITSIMHCVAAGN